MIAQLKGVSLSFDGDIQALKEIDLAIRQGEYVCILGANGSGKTTLAQVLCGLLAPDEGSLELLGHPVFDGSRSPATDFEAYKQARRGLGLVFQSPDDQIVTTIVEEDVAFGPENLGLAPDEIEVRVRREIHRVALDAYAKADPTKLSGGQKQRVAIAGALALEPELLVLDEPGSLLDVRGREAILRVVGRLHKEGTSIVHITHFMDEALQADRVVVLQDGRIGLEGTPQEVFSNHTLIENLGLELPFVEELRWALQDSNNRWTSQEQTHTDAALQETQSYSTDSTQALTAGRAGTVTQAANESCMRVQNDKVHASAQCINGNACVRVQGLSYSYKGAQETKALDDVSFAIGAGSSCAIIGQTGSGKSTLMRLLCALDVPDSGTILVNGLDTSMKKQRKLLHGQVGYVMQHPERQLFAETVLEDVAYGPRNKGLKGQALETCCARALALVGLTGLEDASPFELSGGQRRLCAIAGVLAMEPTCLFLDEPMAGLDPRGRAEIRTLLHTIQERGTTVVCVTHSMEDAALLDRVIVLDQGHIYEDTSPQKLFVAQRQADLQSLGLGLPAASIWQIRLEKALGVKLSVDKQSDLTQQPDSTEQPIPSNYSALSGQPPLSNPPLLTLEELVCAIARLSQKQQKRVFELMGEGE